MGGEVGEKRDKKEIIEVGGWRAVGCVGVGGIVCINTVSSQRRVSFQAFVAAPTMKCVCPPKPYTHSGGFPDLREAERRRRRSTRGGGGGGGESAVANAHYQSGQPAREQGLFTGLLTARPWQLCLRCCLTAPFTGKQP